MKHSNEDTYKCPCCKGKGYVDTFDMNWEKTMRFKCTHCMGKGALAYANIPHSKIEAGN